MPNGWPRASKKASNASGSQPGRSLAGLALAKNRIVDPAEVVRRNPEVILASWCGKAVRTPRIASRPGWGAIDAVRDGHVCEIKSSIILQPGPASLTDLHTGLQPVLRQLDAAR